MRRLTVFVLLLALVASACGGGSSGRSEEEVGAVGGGLAEKFGDAKKKQAKRNAERNKSNPTNPPAATPDPKPSGGQTSQYVYVPNSDHPTDADGNTIVNATVRETDGLRLTFVVGGELTYEKHDIITFEIIAENLGDDVRWYDPDAQRAVTVHPGDGSPPVWWSPNCTRSDDGVDTGLVSIEPGARTTLQYQYVSTIKCEVPVGRWTATGQFPFCSPAKVSGGKDGTRPTCSGSVDWLTLPGIEFDVIPN